MADDQVVLDDLVEELPPGQRTIEDLGQGELRLEEGEPILETSGPIGRCQLLRQDCQPFADQGIELPVVEPGGDRLGAGGICAGQQAIVQRLEGDAFLGQLPLQVFVAVEQIFIG